MSLETAILNVINSSETVLTLNDILNKLKHLGVKTRTLQRAIINLIDANRMRKAGAASNTNYWQKDVREAYTGGHRLLFVHKKEKVAGYLFHNTEQYLFTYTDQYLIDEEEPIVGLDFSIEAIKSTELPAAFDEKLSQGLKREIC
jgi:hypothetical protein